MMKKSLIIITLASLLLSSCNNKSINNTHETNTNISSNVERKDSSYKKLISGNTASNILYNNGKATFVSKKNYYKDIYAIELNKIYKIDSDGNKKIVYTGEENSKLSDLNVISNVLYFLEDYTIFKLDLLTGDKEKVYNHKNGAGLINEMLVVNDKIFFICHEDIGYKCKRNVFYMYDINAKECTNISNKENDVFNFSLFNDVLYFVEDCVDKEELYSIQLKDKNLLPEKIMELKDGHVLALIDNDVYYKNKGWLVKKNINNLEEVKLPFKFKDNMFAVNVTKDKLFYGKLKKDTFEYKYFPMFYYNYKETDQHEDLKISTKTMFEEEYDYTNIPDICVADDTIVWANNDKLKVQHISKLGKEVVDSYINLEKELKEEECLVLLKCLLDMEDSIFGVDEEANEYKRRHVFGATTYMMEGIFYNEKWMLERSCIDEDAFNKLNIIIDKLKGKNFEELSDNTLINFIKHDEIELEIQEQDMTILQCKIKFEKSHGKYLIKDVIKTYEKNESL